ncbi:class F sortase [Pseudonocardia parietis]|uniref:Sortase family protein n=1 Tax=Pseudonocardia parietis TaxID=570936 RepID=A0ABS4W3J8_9PSEU|nr:class F sortase [Pseudonocardia parietis]MBP2370744.1 hypothetical protein [Pseudonocardia parietis]
MRNRRRHQQDGIRGAAALLLSGAVLLGTGAGIAMGDGPQITAEDLGTVPAASSGPGSAQPVPAAEVLPVLVPPDPASPLSAAGPGRERSRQPAAAPQEPAGPAAVPWGEPALPAPVPAEERARPLSGPAAPAPRPAGPAPIAPKEPWTVSPIHRPPADPVPAAASQPVVPATLELPARGITAPVESVGTGPDGGMVIPEQVRNVGWWSPGVLPGGAAGSAVIAGHVDSRTHGVGVLAVLPELTVGEPVAVRGADGRAATYRVTARREYGKYDLPSEVFRRDGPPQLVLITCGGVFDPATGSYESNIVVYAVPEPA